MTRHRKNPNGSRLEWYFAKKPRPVYLEGYVFVWDNGNTTVWLPDDEVDFMKWLRRTLSDAIVWVYKIRADLVARGRVKDIVEEVSL